MHMGRLFDSSRTLKGGYKLSSLCADLLGWGKSDMKVVFGKPKLKADGTAGKQVIGDMTHIRRRHDSYM